MDERKVIVYIAVSLDGYIAKEDGSIDWLDPEIVEEDTTYEDFYRDIDTVILGRTTYDQIVTELSPGQYPYEKCESFVLTSRDNISQEEHIHFVHQPVTKLVKQLKAKKGKNIWIVGGNSLIDPLVSENLIDEYILAVVPIIIGKGIPLFHQIKREAHLKPVCSYTKNDLTYLFFKKQED
ncbi:dihydrofolate reductase family protein [Vagococcus entomophilus]|uniref:Riboflavin biosynthesis protein RibD n=1 Tax=Vagococcus entomophilus TaxID=1160095 RepID=A0A430AFH4_9ENTE|nr:dihydrofolate reductase family protein [Vagococcus entomophilus]RSU06493.1 riboflavin biosynthesis protein RibD [Vagococcus entomophilus]